MKKFVCFTMTVMMIAALAACGGKDNADTNNNGSSANNSMESSMGSSAENNASSSVSDNAVDSSNGAESIVDGVADMITDPLDLLTTIWDSYGDDDRFPAAGGDFSEENQVMDGPGRYGMDDASMVDSTLGLPEGSVSKVDDTASLMHMMNANTFTSGAFHVADSADVEAIADELRDNIQKRQWICGFPDKLVIMSVDDIIISAFGEEEIVNTFKAKTEAAYSNVKTLYDEPIGQ